MARRSSNVFSVLALQTEEGREEEEEESESRSEATAGARAVGRTSVMTSNKKRRPRNSRPSAANAADQGVGKLLSRLSVNGNGVADVREEVEREQDASFPPLLPPAPSSKNNESDASLLKWPLVWIDLEMTGLDVEKDRILEIACIITDGKLHEQIEGPDLIINQSEEHLQSMNDWCQTQHTASGLIEGVRKSTLTEKEAEQEVLEFVRLHAENGGKLLSLAGNSVYVDLLFLKKYMPDLAALFSHVVVDVSSINALCLRWFPNDAKQAPVKKKSHRALEDIKESIAELRYMQKTIFKSSRRLKLDQVG